MTDVPLSVRPDTKLAAAFLKMRIGHFRHLPVVDGGALVGMVTDRDLRRPHMNESATTQWHELYDVDDERPVRDIMTTEVRSVGPDQPLEDAVDIFVEHGYGALPVVDEGTLIGILSVYDVLRATHELLQGEPGE
jgi:acetoin utilization protein AcuB